MKTSISSHVIELLKSLIATPSFSSEEIHTAALIGQWLRHYNIPYQRHENNIYAFNKHFDSSKPLLLLNSHHDTVKPNKAYTRDPFSPKVEDGKLFGLGSNDAGGALVSLLAAFTFLYEISSLSHNIVIVASAEEESSGPSGLNSILPLLPHIDVAIVGEPTLLDLAIAEKGLIVFDATVTGTPGHAAHPNNDNAIYNSISVLEWFRDFKFEKTSPFLGEVKITVTQLASGSQHNVIPARVDLVVDVRVNDCYTNAQIAEILQKKAPCSLKPRSLKLGSSYISPDHKLVQTGIALGKKTYGSPTLSDQTTLNCHSMKVGPGDSKRSHSADEYIYVKEIEDAVDFYIALLEGFLK